MKSLKLKQKYRGLFDGGVLSIHSANYISEDLGQLFKDKARLYCETSDFLIGLKEEQRIEFRKQILKKVDAAGWSVINETPFKHHFLLEVSGCKGTENISTADQTANEDDFLDLSGL